MKEWKSYDAAAATHDRLVPVFFAPPARDLISRIGIPPRAWVLDVGSGTGIAGLLAREAGGPDTLVVALDPAVAMLRSARGHGLIRVVGGAVPGLPFQDGGFDRVMGNFVLSHLAQYGRALHDMTRVLRPGGKLGVTTWGTNESECRRHWQALADSFAGQERLRSATQEALPWEEWFQDPAHLQRALEEAGLTAVEVHHTHYRMSLTTADFLASRENSLQGRFMRQILSDTEWAGFKQVVSEEFTGFSDPMEHERDFYIGVGEAGPVI